MKEVRVNENVLAKVAKDGTTVDELIANIRSSGCRRCAGKPCVGAVMIFEETGMVKFPVALPFCGPGCATAVMESLAIQVKLKDMRPARQGADVMPVMPTRTAADMLREQEAIIAVLVKRLGGRRTTRQNSSGSRREISGRRTADSASRYGTTSGSTRRPW